VDNNLRKLKALIRSYSRVAVAFSGGVDSSLLLAISSEELPGNVLALTARTPFQSAGEVEMARNFARKLGVSQEIITVNILENEAIASNPTNRCYLCKKEIFKTLLKVAKKKGCEVLFDGTNADDTKDYRPGLKAIKELGIESPFMKLGLGKKWIRKQSKELNLPTWDLPANACLASRISYHTRITTDLLRRIEEGENFLKKLGLTGVRLRIYNDVACVEVDPSQIKSIFEDDKHLLILEKIKEMGFTVVALDLEGHVSGKLNRRIVEIG